MSVAGPHDRTNRRISPLNAHHTPMMHMLPCNSSECLDPLQRAQNGLKDAHRRPTSAKPTSHPFACRCHQQGRHSRRCRGCCGHRQTPAHAPHCACCRQLELQQVQAQLQEGRPGWSGQLCPPSPQRRPPALHPRAPRLSPAAAAQAGRWAVHPLPWLYLWAER